MAAHPYKWEYSRVRSTARLFTYLLACLWGELDAVNGMTKQNQMFTSTEPILGLLLISFKVMASVALLYFIAR